MTWNATYRCATTLYTFLESRKGMRQPVPEAMAWQPTAVAYISMLVYAGAQVHT